MLRFRTMVMAVAAAGLLSFFATAPLSAAPRVALVIGNASYAHAPALANPLNDAADMDAALERLGFAVTRLENVGGGEMRRGLNEFRRAASASEVAVVFYAGHGIEVDGRNFLVPVDARLASDQDVEYEAIPLELASRAVERASGLRLVILDACRENPFAVSMQRAGATRSIGRGLARVEPSGETLVAYAAKEGTVASDGDGRNSPYSEALLRFLEEPGLEVMFMFRKVRDAVVTGTGGQQTPFVYGSLSSKGVYLAAGPSPGPSPPERASTVDESSSARVVAERELLFWESVKDSEHPVDIQLYLDRYPGGTYEALARNRLKRLEGAVQPAVPPESEVPAASTQDSPSVEHRMAVERLAAEREFWVSVKGSEDPADIRAYLEQFPDGMFEALARNRLKRLDASAANILPPKSPKSPKSPESSLPETTAVSSHEASPISSSSPESVEKALGLTRAQRALAQRGLTALKFDPGLADGVFGPRTRTAIGKWQASLGETVTGYLDSEAAKTLLAAGEAAPSLSSKRRAKLLQEAMDLLSEALQAVATDERERPDWNQYGRDWARSWIAEAQAKAGDIHGALATMQQIEDSSHGASAIRSIVAVQETDFQGALLAAQQIKDDVYNNRDQALFSIAGAQAKAGDIQGALAVTRQIETGEESDRALSSIAGAQAKAGDIQGALAVTRQIKTYRPRASALAQIAEAQAETGNDRGASRRFSEAVSAAQKISESYDRAGALTQIAEAQTKTGNDRGASRSVIEALSAARRSSENYQRAWALSSIAVAQAKAGDIQGAVTTTQQIEDDDDRASTLSSIAEAQAEAGDERGAARRFSEALSAVRRISENHERSWPLSSIAEAQARAGDVQGALTTTHQIEDDDYRAWTLSSIAEAQAEAGDVPGAEHSLSEALLTARLMKVGDHHARALARIARALVMAANNIAHP